MRAAHDSGFVTKLNNTPQTDDARVTMKRLFTARKGQEPGNTHVTTSMISATSSASQDGTRSSTTHTTLANLRNQMAMQEKREEHIEEKIRQALHDAKLKKDKGDTKGALFALKRKKLFEAEIEKIQNVKMTLETQAIHLESAAQNMDTLHAMQTGSKALKHVRNSINVQSADDIVDNVRAEMEFAHEVNTILSTGVDPTMEDDEELLAELYQVVTGTDAVGVATTTADAEQMSPVASKPQQELPAVPKTKLPVVARSSEKDAEDEMKKLEAELAALY